MAPNIAAAKFKVGDMVKILRSNYKRAKIVELRGGLGPGGKQVYRVLIRRKPSKAYIELLEEQIVLLPPEDQSNSRID